VIVYVSCAPSSLARDLAGSGLASGSAYAIERVQPVDMFPHTPHIETVVVMRRAARTVTRTPARRRAPR
jgi:23S rRNA (uracil1939-C5)-methyltransferase